MIIVHNKDMQRKVRLKDIKLGCVFFYDGIYCLKVEDPQLHVFAVDLEDGRSFFVGEKELVLPLSSKLIITEPE